MNPFFRPHNVIPTQPHIAQLAQLLMKPQTAPHQGGPGMLTPDEITLTAHKKRPLQGAQALGQNNSLPKGGESGI